MPAHPLPAENRPALYRVEPIDDSIPVIPVTTPSPKGAALDEQPVFRIDHPLYERDQRAGWLADELLEAGDVFDGMVHIPSAKTGKKKSRAVAGTAPLTYATFKGVIDRMLRQSTQVEEVCLPDELVAEAILKGPNSLSHHKVVQGGELLARLFVHYWRAVAKAFPEAWNDTGEHIFWHPHVLDAFATFGAQVVQEQVASYDIRQHYFDEALAGVAEAVSLRQDDYGTTPSRELSKRVLERLRDARDDASSSMAGPQPVPDTVRSIDWGSTAAPQSPWNSSVPSGFDE